MSALTLSTILPLIALLTLSALFSAAEASVTAIPRMRIRKLKKSRSRGDRKLAALLSNQSRAITALLVGNNVVNVWASSIATAFTIGIFGEGGVGIATAAMTVIIIVFSEITPKTVASGNPEPVARALTPFVNAVSLALTPIVFLFTAINSLFLRLLAKVSPETGLKLTDDELKTMMAVGRDEGALDAGEHQLLDRAFRFADDRLRSIMTPRTEIAAIDVSSGREAILAAFREHRYSRMPVYSGSIDSILGIVHYKDILFLGEEDGSFKLDDIIRPTHFAPESQSLRELLVTMRRDRVNMTIVVDEHGATVGLVTMEDAIASVYGGISDEYDGEMGHPLEKIVILGPKKVRVPGNLRISDLNSLLRTSIASEYYDTVAGFVMEKANRLPERGEVIAQGHLSFRVDEVASRSIAQVTVTLH